MSRAFVKESAESAPPPERMVSEGPNLVTKDGYAQIAAEVARLEAALKDRSASGPDVLARETLARDLRYWLHQRDTAQVVAPSTASRSPPPANAGEENESVVAFGSTVTIRRGSREQTFRIVGADEADPARGLINFASPLAAAVIGARMGDVIEADAPLGEIEILDVKN
jgi:transcription elongation GreA/GreB family factor